MPTTHKTNDTSLMEPHQPDAARIEMNTRRDRSMLPLKQRLPFASCPPFCELSNERILCNDVVLPHESHPHGMRLWVIGNVFGAVAAVWAGCEQDALDEMVDADLGASFLVSDEDQKDASEDERDGWAHLGDAGEPADLSDAWIGEVDLNRCNVALLCRFAEARGANVANLDKL